MTALALVTMTEDDARRLTERIRLTAHTFAESRTKLIELVEEAKAGNAHAALGYASWTAYLSDVLGDEPLRLARDDRREMVAILSSEGMSTRAIAPIVGVSQATVAREVRAPESNDSPVTGMDGKTYAPKPDVIRVDTNTGEVLDAATVSAPRNPPRRALTDQFFDAVYDLTKIAERIARLGEDDRFSQNADKVAAKHRNDLVQARDAVQGVINRLPAA